MKEQQKKMQFVLCVTLSPHTYKHEHEKKKKNLQYPGPSLKDNLFRDNEVCLVSKWHRVAYRRSGQLPCGSWRFPGDSRRHTDTSSPRGRESPPPADGTRWSSPRGSSALQNDCWLLRLAFIVTRGWSIKEMKFCRDSDEWNLNLIRLSAANRSAICQEEKQERMLLKTNQFQGFCLDKNLNSVLYTCVRLILNGHSFWPLHCTDVCVIAGLLKKTLVKTSVLANRWPAVQNAGCTGHC